MTHQPNTTEFSDPRLVALYDVLNPFGEDSTFFCSIVDNFKPKTVIDLGSGTGLVTCELAQRGYNMVGIEPSAKMLSAALAKQCTGKIFWVRGSYETMPGMEADMVMMTSHVAQFFLEDSEWQKVLKVSHDVLSPRGHLLFDVRVLTNPPFPSWPTKETKSEFTDTQFGPVQWWYELIGASSNRVQYELHYFFKDSGDEVVSLNELAFRSQEKIEKDLSDTGFTIKKRYGDWNGGPITKTSEEMVFVVERKK